MVPDVVGDALDDPPEHVGGGVLGEEVEDEPVADVAAIHQIVQQAALVEGERAKVRSVENTFCTF